MNFLISRSFVTTLCLFAISLAAPLPGIAQRNAKKDDKTAEATEGIAGKTAGMEKKEGLLTFYVDRQKAGKVWLEVPPASGPGWGGGELHLFRRRC